jgi:serine phosphatase RsbU (regulator of sigma subunit)
MIHGGLGDRFVTLAVMVLDPFEHSVTVVNAGHMAPKWYRAATDQLVDSISLDATGVPIGALPGYPFEQVTFTLDVGDSVAMFTDGVTDAMNPAGKMFSQKEVEKHLTTDDSALAADAQRAKRLGERLVAAVRAHANGRPQNDDIAVVAFGRLDAGLGPNTTANKATNAIKQQKLPV